MGNGGLLGLQARYINEDEDEIDYESYGADYLATQELDTWETKMEPKMGRFEKNAPVAQVRLICIKGAVGKFSQYINSSFVETAKMHNDRALYRNVSSPEHWLRYATNGQWMVSTTKDIEENLCGGVCFCETVGLPDPTCAKGWCVLDEEQGEFRTQAMVQATDLVGLQNVDEKIQPEDDGVPMNGLAVTRSTSEPINQKSAEKNKTPEQLSLHRMFEQRERRRRASIGHRMDKSIPTNASRRRKNYWGESKQSR